MSHNQVTQFYWQQYFEGEASPKPDDGRLAVIETFRNFLSSPAGNLLLGDVDLGSSSTVLLQWEPLTQALAPWTCDFAQSLRQTPGIVLGCFGLALCQMRAQRYILGALLGPKITARIEGFQPQTAISQLKANTIGTFVQVTGNVVRVSSVQPLVVKGEFDCEKCGAQMERGFEDGKYSPPLKCINTKCRSKTFYLNRDRAETVDMQRIKLQEIEESDDSEAGRMPRTVEVELVEDLVDSCTPGDVVTICGVVKSVNAQQGSGGSFKQGGFRGHTSLYILYIRANSLTNSRLSKNDPNSALRNFTDKELEKFQEIASEPECFELLVHSLCPTIFGHELVKAGLTLALFGGSPRDSEIPCRSDIHVLVVGDPGLGKSQMLQAVNHVAPRSVYVGGNTASTTGLTVTLAKDSNRGDIGLEAGALVLSDQGVCCIDEFDKMACDYHALLEAMEQQQISIAKSGVVASLSARCSIVAAANPVGGHYRRDRALAENLKMSSALLSRFDIIFILLDNADKDHDKKLSEHIMRMHALAAGRNFDGYSHFENDSARFVDEDAPQRTLSQRLRFAARRCTASPVSTELLRKYIAWARKTTFPKLTLKAAKVLQRLYLTLRKEARRGHSMPITTRQLESLIRLAQARAKLELRDWVTEQDANDVVEMMEESLLEAFTNESGVIDFSGHGTTKLSKQVKIFVAALNKKAEQQGSPFFHLKDLIELPNKLGFEVNNFESFLDVLSSECYLLKKGHNMYQLQTSVYSQYSQRLSSNK